MFELIEGGKVPIKSWTKGVQFDEKAKVQVRNLANLPFIHKWIAVMPDVHLGTGSTIGSVIPTIGAVIPSAVGVDIGCGMMAVKTSLTSLDLPDSLVVLRDQIEKRIPHGNKNGSWNEVPDDVYKAWEPLNSGFKNLCNEYKFLEKSNNVNQLGTLVGGNHFIEICLDENNVVWVMLHSGSRGIGNKIGTHFITEAKKEMEKWFIHLPDKDLAYISEGSSLFSSYTKAMSWAQDFARVNREVMMIRTLQALKTVIKPNIALVEEAINCHHNYIRMENHYDKNIWVTRKGAVSAHKGEMGIIPGSMGAKSFIVKSTPVPIFMCV